MEQRSNFASQEGKIKEMSVENYFFADFMQLMNCSDIRGRNSTTMLDNSISLLDPEKKIMWNKGQVSPVRREK